MKAIVYTILFEGALRVKSHNNYLLSSSFLHSIVYHSTQAMIQSKLWSCEWNSSATENHFFLVLFRILYKVLQQSHFNSVDEIL